MQVLENQHLHFSFSLLHHACTTEGAVLGPQCLFLLSIHKNSPFRGQQSIFTDSIHKNGHFYGQQTSLHRVEGNLARGRNCPRHGITQKSLPGSHSRHTNYLEDRARSPHRETSDRSRSCRTYQEPPSEKYPESPKSSPQCKILIICTTICPKNKICFRNIMFAKHNIIEKF